MRKSTSCLQSARLVRTSDESRAETIVIPAYATSGQKKPLRKVYEQPEAWEHLFTAVGKRLNVPIAQGLPVGHGPNYAPLPLGAKYELSHEGKLKLLEWDWLSRSIVA